MSKTWHQALAELKPFVVKIATPDGYGTGFQILYRKDRILCGLATAYHVVSHAEEWEEPIKLTHIQSGKSTILKEKDRVIFTYPAKDLAFILFDKNLLPLEEKEPRLVDPEKVLKQGVAIGWCGFPHIAPDDTLCFFGGHISASVANEDYYLVDGVAINGVSGGPAFHINSSTDEVKICGVVSAYRPNRIYGEAHPGLSKICSVEPFHETLNKLNSKEEAQEKAKEVKESQEKPELQIEQPPVKVIEKSVNQKKKAKKSKPKLPRKRRRD